MAVMGKAKVSQFYIDDLNKRYIGITVIFGSSLSFKAFSMAKSVPVPELEQLEHAPR